MKAKPFFVMSMASVLLLACQEKQTERATLQTKIDSLVLVVENNQKLNEILFEADALLDSIDLNRNVLRNKLWEGTSFEDFTHRIKELNAYVKRSESKIQDLETALRSAKQSGNSYNARIKDLKDAVNKSNQEILALQEQVSKYRDENETLIKTVNLQQAEIDDKLSQIKVREEEVVKLEGRISEILTQSRMDEAEAYYARGEALELAAVRTNFLSVKKKKTTRQQAMDMYQMAVLYGKHEAQAKVDALAKKL